MTGDTRFDGAEPAIHRSGTAGTVPPAKAILVEYQARLRSAAVEISLAAERERREIAGEVHDNIGQELAIAKLRLGELRANAQGDLLTALDEIHARLAGALQSCRMLSYNLAMPALYKLGLVPAVKNLAADFQSRQKIDFVTQYSRDDIPLDSTAEIILYRVIRELLTNIVKHAKARRVEVSIMRVDNNIQIVIADDGIGFDVQSKLETSSADPGLGLFLVRERLWHLGGTFDLESSAGKGTRATLTAPLSTSKLAEGGDK